MKNKPCMVSKHLSGLKKNHLTTIDKFTSTKKRSFFFDHFDMSNNFQFAIFTRYRRMHKIAHLNCGQPSVWSFLITNMFLFGDVLFLHTFITRKKQSKTIQFVNLWTIDDRSILVKFKVILRFACQNIVNVTKTKIQMNEEKK